MTNETLSFQDDSQADVKEHAELFHRSLLTRIRELDSDIRTLDQKRAELLEAAKAIEKVYPDLGRRYSTGAEGDELRGQEAVVRVLEDATGRWLSVKDLVGELRLRGWIDPEAKAPEEATRVALRRISEARDIIEKRRSGRQVLYRFRSDAPNDGPGASEPSASEGGSDGTAS